MTRRRTAPIAAAVVVLVVASLGWWWGGGERGERRSVTPRDVAAPALPDLTRVDPQVARQVHDAHSELTATLARDGASASDTSEAFGLLGMQLLASEYFAEAEHAFHNAEALAPGDRRWPYYLAQVYRARQEPATAIAAFERVLAIAPDDVPTLIWLGDLHLSDGNDAAAEQYLQRASTLQPDSPAVLSRLGRVALSQGDYERAIAYLERVLRLKPDALTVHYPLGMAYRGAGQFEKAESHLKRASGNADIAPADPLMDAVAALLRNAGAYEARGMAALDARNWPAAVEQLQQAAMLAPTNAVTRLNLGTALSLAGDPTAARRELLEAVRLDPGLAKAHFALALLEQDEGRWSAAVEHFSMAVERDPVFVDAHFALAEALRRTGRAEESLRHYKRVLELNAAASQARFGYAMALVRLRRYAEARTWLSEAVRLHPDQPGLPHALARILAAAPEAQARDGQRALALMQPLLQAPPSPAVSETMAMVHAELGRFVEAAEWQQRAIAAAQEAGQHALASRMWENLALYRQRRPCRTPWRDDDPVIAVVAG